LLLGSDYEGEVLAAAYALKRCLTVENITFAALASRVGEPQYNIKQQQHRHVAEMAQQMLREENDNESRFVFEMGDWLKMVVRCLVAIRLV
jgi:hypothetical protein